METELSLRIKVIDPPQGVPFCMQRGKSELVPPLAVTEEGLTFALTVRVGESRPNGSPNFLGPFTQGPADGRFVYINSGTLAGVPESPWTARAKVPLTDITWRLIEQIRRTPNSVLEARIAGTGKKGGPACATVPLLDEGWKVVSVG